MNALRDLLSKVTSDEELEISPSERLIWWVYFTHNKDGRNEEVIEQAAEELAALRAREVCTGCGTKKIDTILAVINGAAACCPDCTTLTVDERNAIREAIRARVEAAEREQQRMKAKLIMVSKWFERQADMFEKQANNSRFETIKKAAEFDAKNYKAMADDILAATLAAKGAAK